MDKQLHDIVVNIAARKPGLKVAPSFQQRIDAYLSRADVARLPEAKKRIVAAFLCSAAINIAAKDRKVLVEGEDVKAALWLYHVPRDENDECVQASANILRIAGADAGELHISADSEMKPRMVKLDAEFEAWVVKDKPVQRYTDIEGLGAG